MERTIKNIGLDVHKNSIVLGEPGKTDKLDSVEKIRQSG